MLGRTQSSSDDGGSDAAAADPFQYKDALSEDDSPHSKQGGQASAGSRGRRAAPPRETWSEAQIQAYKSLDSVSAQLAELSVARQSAPGEFDPFKPKHPMARSPVARSLDGSTLQRSSDSPLNAALNNSRASRLSDSGSGGHNVLRVEGDDSQRISDAGDDDVNRSDLSAGERDTEALPRGQERSPQDASTREDPYESFEADPYESRARQRYQTRTQPAYDEDDEELNTSRSQRPAKRHASEGSSPLRAPARFDRPTPGSGRFNESGFPDADELLQTPHSVMSAVGQSPGEMPHQSSRYYMPTRRADPSPDPEEREFEEDAEAWDRQHRSPPLMRSPPRGRELERDTRAHERSFNSDQLDERTNVSGSRGQQRRNLFAHDRRESFPYGRRDEDGRDDDRRDEELERRESRRESTSERRRESSQPRDASRQHDHVSEDGLGSTRMPAGGWPYPSFPYPFYPNYAPATGGPPNGYPPAAWPSIPFMFPWPPGMVPAPNTTQAAVDGARTVESEAHQRRSMSPQRPDAAPRQGPRHSPSTSVDMQQYEDQIEELQAILQSERAMADKEIKRLHQMFDEQGATLRTVTQREEELSQELTRARGTSDHKVEVYVQRIDLLEKERNAMIEQINNLTDQVRTLTVTVKKAEETKLAQIKSSDAFRQDAAHVRSSLEKAMDDNQRLQESTYELSQKLKEASHQIRVLEDRAAQYQQESDNVRRQLTTLRGTSQQHEQMIATQHTSVEQITREKEGLTKSLRQAHEQVASLKEDLQRSVPAGRHATEVQGLQRTVADLREKLANAAAQYSDLESRHINLVTLGMAQMQSTGSGSPNERISPVPAARSRLSLDGRQSFESRRTPDAPFATSDDRLNEPRRPTSAVNTSRQSPLTGTQSHERREDVEQRMDRAASLEATLMKLNFERQKVESALNKMPLTGGKTMRQRQEKQENEDKLEMLSREINKVKASLRELKML